MEFFSVKCNSWKEIEGIDFPYVISLGQPPVLFNGAIHWLATKLGRAQAPESEIIIAFDLVGKNFSKTPLPNGEFYDAHTPKSVAKYKKKM